MGLGTYLLGIAIEKAAPTIADVAIKTTVGVTAMAVGGAATVVSGVADKVSDAHQSRKKREEQTKIAAQANKNYTDYDVKLICAKVAICSYIIHADNRVSDAEKKYINQVFEGIKSEYGKEVLSKAKSAYDSCSSNFTNLQEYLRKVKVKDLKQYLTSADEVAIVDGYDESEARAIQRIKNFINPLENVDLPNTICSSCGGRIHLDEYGYKAVCNYCGEEVIINSNNAPLHAFENNTTATNRSANNVAVQDKHKKGKIALKVALGVMTGGVSLIPDAVGAVKKKS